MLSGSAVTSPWMPLVAVTLVCVGLFVAVGIYYIRNNQPSYVSIGIDTL